MTGCRDVVHVFGIHHHQLFERLWATVTHVQKGTLRTRTNRSLNAVEEILHAGKIQRSVALSGDEDRVSSDQPFKSRQHGVVPLADNGPRSEARPVAVG